MARSALALGLALALGVGGCGTLPWRGPDVVFIATPEDVAGQMLRMAAVTERDVVYDLGSGDGRLVIAAARDFGARGVGVEIDADLVRRSTEAAGHAGVTDRARFLWQDLFATDIGEATVVTLYLRNDVNLRLRPKLLSELAPGTRVVSHDFHMGDWTPDRTLEARGHLRTHRLLLWLVPADLAGTWRVTLHGADGAREATLTLTQRFQEVTGTLGLEGSSLAAAGRVAGRDVELRAGTLALIGRVEGEAIRGRGEGVEWEGRRLR